MQNKSFQNLDFYKRNASASHEAKYDLTERKPYALDNIRYLACALAAWISQLLHHGRIHSYPARYCNCDFDYQFDFRTQVIVSSRQ